MKKIGDLEYLLIFPSDNPIKDDPPTKCVILQDFKTLHRIDEFSKISEIFTPNYIRKDYISNYI